MNPPRIERRALCADAGGWPESMHPVLRRVYAARGVVSPRDIEHRLASLLPPRDLGGIARACELVENAIRTGARIIIVGDFDADGATATAVAVRGLRLLGAQDLGYAVPNRFRHGYGLSPAIVEELLQRQPKLLITVDNGIAAHAGVAAAKAHGMQVIVTDHHLPGATLPGADAIVNPNVPGDAFSSKALAGVGVMFYLLLALRARLREKHWFDEQRITEPDLSCLIDLVALGTVADLVPLDCNNRILVDAGLKRIRSGRCCAGITALIACGQRDPARLVASDLGFVVAPRINAAGRLEDMGLGIECLLADDSGRARELAETLSSINAERRQLQADMVEQAQYAVHKWTLSRGRAALPRGVVLFDPGWHHGVVGLVASKLKEMLNRPVIACAPATMERDDRTDARNEVKASGRSIAGFHLRDALADVDARHPGLLLRFGGHAMAAGLSLRRDDVETFAAAFDAVAQERIAPAALEAILLTDGELGTDDFSLGLARQLRYAGPWGQGFAEPMFDGVFAVESWRVVAEKHMRFRLRSDGGREAVDAIMFNASEGLSPPERLRAVFSLDLDEWQGTERLQLLLRHWQPV
ncbi:MAG: single-stranded-DNA-specific exonuclease RecJ [Rudaea sp.]|nr:single-stranded-DNA-specific exonuclease RecJ [Rudaea sp.]